MKICYNIFAKKETLYLESVYKVHVLTPSPTPSVLLIDGPPLKGGESMERLPLKGGAYLSTLSLERRGRGRGCSYSLYTNTI